MISREIVAVNVRLESLDASIIKANELAEDLYAKCFKGCGSTLEEAVDEDVIGAVLDLMSVLKGM
jgi:hypothetical protein